MGKCFRLSHLPRERHANRIMQGKSKTKCSERSVQVSWQPVKGLHGESLPVTRIAFHRDVMSGSRTGDIEESIYRAKQGWLRWSREELRKR
jgi:hypothetical protein